MGMFDWSIERDLKDYNVWTISTTDVRTIDYCPNNVTTGTILFDDLRKTKHFNCKRCGAPNQIDVCEYCGCAYEEN